MVSVQDRLRRLDAEYAQGRMSPQDHARRRDAIFDSIPEVREVPPNRPNRTGPAVPWNMALVAAGALATVTIGVAVLTRDLTLALTLAVTLMAALAVAALRALDP